MDYGTINCHICGKEFKKYRDNSRFCSEVCRTTRVSKTNRRTILCKRCSVEFSPVNTLVKYCSPLCRERQRDEDNRKIIRSKPCKICKTEFTPVSASGVYCTFACKTVGRSAAKKKYLDTEEGKEKTTEYNKTYKRYANEREMRDHNLRAHYGISVEQYEAMSLAQNHVCAICRIPFPGKKPLCVDHNHSTNLVRQLLCLFCNNLIGNARESVEILESAIAYIKLHNQPK